MHKNLTTITGTSRQRVISRNGIELQRQYIVLPAATWEQLTAISISQHRSGSQIIESLVNIASSSGKHKKDIHDSSTPSNL